MPDRFITQVWTCTRCGREQVAGTPMTIPGTADRATGIISLQQDAPVCCPHCAETLAPGPGRVDVLLTYLGAIPREGKGE